MTLNPDELEVTSFDTTAEPDALGVFATSTCPVFPTPATQCFVCPAPTSRQDGC